jgi:hypothetical protein
MSSRQVARIAFFGGVVGTLAMPASGASLGHPGVSTKGATCAQTQWSLICDPSYVLNGSFTTNYSSNATIDEVEPIFPYMINTVMVELVDAASKVSYNKYLPDATGVVDIAPASFNGLKETGRVQVSWAIQPGQTLPSAPDDDVYQVCFNQTPGSNDPIGIFSDGMTNFGNAVGAPSPDFYSGFTPDPINAPFTYSTDPQSPFFVPQSSITTETLTELIGTPEPASIGLIAVVGGIGLLRRRRT